MTLNDLQDDYNYFSGELFIEEHCQNNITQ